MTVTLPSYLTEEVLSAIVTGSFPADQPVDAATATTLSVLRTLAGMGLLAEDYAHNHEVTDEDVEHTARWLALMSEHPRYGVDGYGWRGILAAEGNVDHAHAEAVRIHGPEQRPSLDAARVLLRDAIRRASEEGS